MKNIKSLSMLILSASAVATINTANADIVHLDDVIVDGSQCVGFDCVNGESFGFDTLRLKENNLRVNFNDTSSSASFPSNDWRIVVNDSANGGGSYFAVEDSTAGRTPFRVDAGAPTDALRVDSAGDVGIGVANPVVELHMKSGDTPTIRLEQDGSSGFTPQTYDIGSNESNFFIRDVTNGSKLFFRAQPSAPANSMYIANDGDIGFGTSSPGTLAFSTDASLHIKRTDGAASILVEETGAVASREMLELRNNGGMYMTFRNTATNDDWFFTSQNSDSGSFIIDSDLGTSAPGDQPGDGAEFTLSPAGDLTIAGDLTTGGVGACSSGCDAVFNSDYDLPSIEDHADYMFKNRHLEAVGPTSESGPFNITRKVGGVLNELE
ncbi:MAG: hypothetical protein JKX81_16730, partial [Arenicella sp.]|nr:hypothetical protein [Arenicella sp.]